MNDKDLREHWLQEKLIGLAIAVIGSLLLALGTVAVWVILEIKTEVKDLSNAMRGRLAKIEEIQMHGAVKVGEILKTHENKIEFNTHRIEKLEESIK